LILVYLSPYLVSFFEAFLLTFSIECLTFLPFARGIGAPRALGAVLLVNAFSLPVVWFVISFMIRDFLVYAFSSELFVIISESILLRMLLPISYKRSILAALTMNLASFMVGWVLPILIEPWS